MFHDSKPSDSADYSCVFISSNVAGHAAKILALALFAQVSTSCPAYAVPNPYSTVGDSERTGLNYQQFGPQGWNSMRIDSALHDTQPRLDSNTASLPVVHQSRPAPDKTQQIPLHVEIAPTKQRNKNEQGSLSGNLGFQNIYNRESWRYTETPATNMHKAMSRNTWRRAAQEISQSPQSNFSTVIANQQGQEQSTANATHNASNNALDAYMPLLIAGNVNIANEASATAGDTRSAYRPVSQAIGMMQQMYKRVYLPMSLLLLLPGAVLLQTKVIAVSMANGDEDTQSGPFTALLRLIIAIALIPATQMIMSYSIDVGNSLTHQVAQQCTASDIAKWARGQQTGRETAALHSTGSAGLDPQPYKDQGLQAMTGLMNMSMGYGLIVLAAFQFVISCYLMLMGPIAASLYCWPGGVGKLFKPVFVNWVNAVVGISLWRFWWMCIVFVMITRIDWLKQIGEYIPNTEWESLMLCCFLILMLYVPFAPFDLKPGDMVDRLLEKAKEVGSGGRTGGRNGSGRTQTKAA